MPAVPFRSAAAVLSARAPLGFEQRRLLLAQHGMRRYEANERSLGTFVRARSGHAASRWENYFTVVSKADNRD